MRFSKLYVAGAIVLFMVSSLSAQQPAARQIMERYKAQDRTDDSSVKLKMTLINPRGGVRKRQVTQVTKTDPDDNRRQLIRFLSPADIAGTGFLSIEHNNRDDDNWLYLPALRKTRRIAGSDKTDSFVGSEFTYEDLDAEDLNAYKYELIASEHVDGVETWIVVAIPIDPKKAKESSYSKRELWITKDHHLVIQTKYYDRQGAYVKLFKASDIRRVPGTEKWRAYHISMEDVRKGKKTVLELSDYKINTGLGGEYFSERYLKGGR